MELIDKSSVITEIERLDEFWHLSKSADGQAFIETLLSFLNTLEVKEVDLDELLSNLDKYIKEFVTTEEFEKDSAIAGHYWAIAKHAFLLGLKAQKGE